MAMTTVGSGRLPVPARSREQRLVALAHANEVRSWRAALKRDVAAGRAQATAVIEDVPEMARTMRVQDLLLAIPKCGRVKVNKILRGLNVAPSKSLAGLSDRQRSALLEMLRS